MEVAPGGDAYEPNDTRGVATAINIGDSAFAAIAPRGDYDWYRFSLSEPSDLRFVAESPSGNEYLYVRLYNVSGTELRSAQARPMDGPAVGTYELAQAGTYYLRVNYSRYDNTLLGSYTVRVETPIAPTLEGYELSPVYPSVSPGGIFTVRYQINNPNPYSIRVNMDARWRRSDGAIGELNPVTSEVTLQPGTDWYARPGNVPSDMQSGVYALAWYLLWTDNREIGSSGYVTNSFEVVSADLEDDWEVVSQVFQFDNHLRKSETHTIAVGETLQH